MRKKVYCKGCDFLLCLEDSTPVCLAMAVFVSGPLRPDVDVSRIAPAEGKNLTNSCTDRRIYSRRARLLKSWILENNKNGYREIGVEGYSRVKEKARTEAFRRFTSNETEDANEAETGDETMGVGRGDDDSVGTGTSDQDGGQFLFDI